MVHRGQVIGPAGWPAIAARRARALPTWRLAALFVGAIAIALLLTIIVARIIH